MRARASPAMSAVAAANADGERVCDGVVAVAEVPVEDLSADAGAVDDVADGQMVDRALVRQRERGVAQAWRGPVRRGDRRCGCVLPYLQAYATSWTTDHENLGNLRHLFDQV